MKSFEDWYKFISVLVKLFSSEEEFKKLNICLVNS